MAALITQIQAFMAFTQMLVMPLCLLRARSARCAHCPPGHLAGRERGAAPGGLGGVGGPVGLPLGVVAVLGVVLPGMAVLAFNAASKDGYAAFPRIYTMTPEEKGDAGWLRGQTTRRRYHRRSDGGPERRQWCPDGGPEHRYEWYTEPPPSVSRPKLPLNRFNLFPQLACNRVATSR